MERNRCNYSNVDFSGQKHDRLTAIKKSEKGVSRWICKCDCGNVVELTAYYFLIHKSCGCLEIENKKTLNSRTTTHGMTETRLYSVWCGMKERCYNKNYKYFSRYGGRGISVCEEWKNSFENFRDWAYKNGYDDSLNGKDQSIDRIDLDGNYEPSNCKWSNQKEQVMNRRNSVLFVYNGITMNPYDFEKCTGVSRFYTYRHLKKGETPEEIIMRWEKLHENKL
jgi:hypothetical protein